MVLPKHANFKGTTFEATFISIATMPLFIEYMSSVLLLLNQHLYIGCCIMNSCSSEYFFLLCLCVYVCVWVYYNTM